MMFQSVRDRRERRSDAHLDAVLGRLDQLNPPTPRRRPLRSVARFVGAAGATLRTAGWRHRKPLAPVAVIAALWMIAAVIVANNLSWPAVLLGAGATAGGLWQVRYGPRLDRRPERIYAAVLLVAAAGWLTAVAAVGGSPT